MSVILSLILATVQFVAPSLPVVTYTSYVSHDAIRAERLFAPEGNAVPPTKVRVQSLGPVVQSQGAIVVDAKSGALLYEKESSTQHVLASITKLMTMLVFLESEPDLTQRVTMEEEDDREGGDDFIRPGESATLEHFLRASLLASANNATIVLSNHAGLSPEAFVERMNAKAQELGMHDTHFVEPTGLDPQNISTPRDIVRLLNAVRSEERITDIAGLSQSSIRVFPSGITRRVFSTNHLLGSIIYVDYGKTGYLDESLYNVATAVYTATGHQLFIVVFGAPTDEDRVQDAKNLAYWAGQTYSWE